MVHPMRAAQNGRLRKNRITKVQTQMTDGKQPAFPEVHIHHFQNEDADGKHDNVVPRWMGGLTKREWFIGMAMQRLVVDVANLERSAILAVQYADKILEIAKREDPEIPF